MEHAPQNHRVLIVDDEKTLLRNLVKKLRRSGFLAEGATTLREARTALDQGGIDLLCLDVRLDDGNGLDLLEHIRMDFPQLPVVVMTAQDTVLNRTRAEKLDAVAFLAKPFSLSRFKHLIDCVAFRTLEDMPDCKIISRRPFAPIDDDDGLVAPCEDRSADGADVTAKIRPVSRGPISVMMYSHDSIGLGHVRRNTNIATVLVQENPNVNVLMMVGCPSGVIFDLPKGVDFLKLPSVVKVETNSWKSEQLRIPHDKFKEFRTKLILRAVELFKPDFFLVDHVPAGVWGELLPTLQMLRTNPNRPKVMLGLRDILDSPEVIRSNWLRDGTYDVISKLYDTVLIYGCQHIYDAAALYGLDRLGRAKTRYVGYVSSLDDKSESALFRRQLGVGGSKLVLVTAGGGRDAFPMMAQCLSALELLDAKQRPTAIFLTGPLMKHEHKAEIKRRARALPVTVLNSVPDSLNYLNAADLVVTMGGYNTVVESIRLGKPIIVVPRIGPSAEQRTRAKVFSDAGLVQSIDPDDATPGRLARAICDNLERQQQPRVSLGINGVGEAVRQIERAIGLDRNEHSPDRASLLEVG